MQNYYETKSARGKMVFQLNPISGQEAVGQKYAMRRMNDEDDKAQQDRILDYVVIGGSIIVLVSVFLATL